MYVYSIDKFWEFYLYVANCVYIKYCRSLLLNMAANII